MDPNKSGRPSRRHAHVCRTCDACFSCKAELLEHEQEGHPTTSASSSPLQGSVKRKSSSVTSSPSITAVQSADGQKASVVVKKSRPAGASKLSARMLALAGDIPVDHEEVHSSVNDSSAAGKTKQQNVQTFVKVGRDGKPVKVHVMPASLIGLAEHKAGTDTKDIPVAMKGDNGKGNDEHGRKIKPSESPSTRNGETSPGDQQQMSPQRPQAHIAEKNGPQSRAPNFGAEATVSHRSEMVAEVKRPRTVSGGDLISAVGLKRRKDLPNVDDPSTATVQPSLLKPATVDPLEKANSRHGVVKRKHDDLAQATGQHSMSTGLKGVQILDGAVDDSSRLTEDVLVPSSSGDVQVELLAGECTVTTSELDDEIIPSRTRKAYNTSDSRERMLNVPIPGSMLHFVDETPVSELAGSRMPKPSISGTRVHLKVPKMPTPSSGGKKRMVAVSLTVAPPPRMVSVLLRNQSPDRSVKPDPACEMVENENSAEGRLAAMEGKVENNADTVNDEAQNIAVIEEPGSVVNESMPEESSVQSTVLEKNEIQPLPVAIIDSPFLEVRVKSSSSEVIKIADPVSNAVMDEIHCIIANNSEQISDAMPLSSQDGAIKVKLESSSQCLCTYCEKCFASPDDLEGHVQTNHICKYCHREFKQISNLHKHVKISHEHKRPHPCPVCGKTFAYTSYLTEHMQVHEHETGADVERRFTCPVCLKSFVRISGLRKHSKEEHMEGPKPYMCQHCDKAYAYRCSLEAHMRRHSGVRPFTCPTCGARFKHLSNVQKHIKILHPPPCAVCADPTQKCEHVEAARAAQRGRFPCARCSRAFDSAAALNVHERVHSGEKPETCEVCGRSFQHRSNLQKHMMKHAGRRPHACTECPRAFYARHSLLAHMRKHTGDSPYECSICQKRFCTKNSLQVHMNLHTEERQYACDTCGRRFAQLGNLQKHMTVHTGERPHACDACTHTFSDISALRRHRAAIHDRDARYACDICDKHFLHLSSVRAHRLLHAGLKPYKCEKCSKAFTHRSGWIRHTRLHDRSQPSINIDGIVKAVVGQDKEVMLKPGEYIVYLTE